MTRRDIGLASVLGLIVLGAAGGIIAAAGFDTAMKATSSQEFCLSCHEMKQFAWQESLHKAHAANRAGFEVSCGECHIPKAFVPKMRRKIIAAREVWHHWLGTIDSAEKYEHHRQRMAERVWADMEADNSAACRNCHQLDKMRVPDPILQMHRNALDGGMTCINCHRGIAHKLPGEGLETSEASEAVFH